MNRVQQSIMKRYGLEIGQEFYILYNKSFDGYKIGERVNNHKYHFDKNGEVLNQKGQKKISILGGLVAERFAIEKEYTIKMKRFERDLLEIYCVRTRFRDWRTLMHLKGKGHFKGVAYSFMTIQEILENCEIVD